MTRKINTHYSSNKYISESESVVKIKYFNNKYYTIEFYNILVISKT